MSFIGATGYNENQEELDTLQDEIDANASYINNLVGIPDPLHTAIFGINLLNPGLFGLVERAEVNIKALQTGLEGEGTTISGIETTISGIETTISGIETEVAGIQTEITGIQGEITGVQGEISSIQFIQLPALTGVVSTIGGIAGDAEIKANRALGIWDEDGNNVYHKKSGNVGIGTTFGSVLTNKLEVNGNINIPTGSTFRIGDEPFNYTHLAGTQPVSSKWTNATDVATNIYYNTGNVGIGITTVINNKLEIGGNLNISAGSKYKINNVDLAFSDLGGTLSYNSLSDKPTLFDGNYNSLTNKLTGGTNIQILNGAINNLYSYTLPTAGVGAGGVLGGVRVDNSTIFINGSGVISSAAGTPQVNSDWNETNTTLKSFILNKPTIVNSRWSKNGNEISYNDGNVGIGTTNPFNVLHLHKFGILQEVGLILSDDASIPTTTNRGLQLIKGANNEGYLFNYENKELIIGTNGTERMRISNTGSVGIGTNTNISGVLLDVNGTIESRTGIGASSVFYFRGVANSDINRVISAGQYSTGSAVNDMVIRSTNKLVLQSGIASPAIVIDTANNVGIGTTNPTSKLHIPTPDVATPFALLDFRNNNNFGIYATSQSVASRGNTLDFLARDYNLNGTIATRNVLSLRPDGYVGIGVNNPQRQLHIQTHMRIGGSGPVIDFGDDFNVQIYRNGTTNEMRFTTNGTDRLIIYNDASVRTPANGAFIATANIARGGGYDIRNICTHTGMYIEMGSEATFSPTYIRMGAYEGATFIESNSNRSIIFRIWSGVNSGTLRAWDFNINGGSYNNFNTTTWNQASDQRIKENIVKADLNKCYDNVKNINLYRYNYIDSFQTSKQDKNKLGYIAQEVKRHFPKAIIVKKERLTDKREIPDLLSIDVEQINLTLYGAVKQLIKIVEKQNKRIKTLETLLNIDDNDDVENDAGEAYERIYDEEEVDIDTIEPTEPEQDKAPEPTATSVNTEPSTEEDIEEINVD